MAERQNAHRAIVTHIISLHGGARLVTCSQDATIRLWGADPAKLSPDTQYRVDTGEVCFVCRLGSYLPFSCVHALSRFHVVVRSCSRSSARHYAGQGNFQETRKCAMFHSLAQSPIHTQTLSHTLGLSCSLSLLSQERARPASAISSSGPINSVQSPSAALARAPACLGELIGHSVGVNAIAAFTDDSFASCGSDSLVILWKVSYLCPYSQCLSTFLPFSLVV